jgi:hypothetical protein
MALKSTNKRIRIERPKRRYTILNALFIPVLGHHMSVHDAQWDLKKKEWKHVKATAAYDVFIGEVIDIDTINKMITMESKAVMYSRLYDWNFPEYCHDSETILTSQFEIFIPPELSWLFTEGFPYGPIRFYPNGNIQKLKEDEHIPTNHNEKDPDEPF